MPLEHPAPTLRTREAVRREVLSPSATGWTLGALAVGLGVLTAVVAARWPPLMSLDGTVARWAFHRTYDHPALTAWWSWVGAVTEPIILRVLMAVAGLLLLWRGSRALGGWLLGVAVLEQLVGPYAKYLLDRPRPHWAHPIEVLGTSSYPAGHATGIACFATVVALLVTATVSSRATRRVLVGTATVLVLLVGVDRVALGMHYLSDVVAGLMLGVATALVGWLVMLRLTRLRMTGAQRGRAPASAAGDLPG